MVNLASQVSQTSLVVDRLGAVLLQRCKTVFFSYSDPLLGLQLRQLSVLDPDSFHHDTPPFLRQDNLHICHLPLLHQRQPQNQRMLQLVRPCRLLLDNILRDSCDVNRFVCAAACAISHVQKKNSLLILC